MYVKPTEVSGGIPDWGTSGEKRDIIPLEEKQVCMQIDYVDIPFSASNRVWDDAGPKMAELERKAKKEEKKGGSPSLVALSVQVETAYTFSLCKKCIKKINGKEVSELWFEKDCNSAMAYQLIKWMKHKIDNKPYPKPDWLLEEEEKKEDPMKASDPGKDQQDTCGEGADGDGIEYLGSSSERDTPITSS